MNECAAGPAHPQRAVGEPRGGRDRHAHLLVDGPAVHHGPREGLRHRVRRTARIKPAFWVCRERLQPDGAGEDRRAARGLAGSEAGHRVPVDRGERLAIQPLRVRDAADGRRAGAPRLRAELHQPERPGRRRLHELQGHHPAPQHARGRRGAELDQQDGAAISSART